MKTNRVEEHSSKSPKNSSLQKTEKEFIRCCHKCGHLNSHQIEMDKCSKCNQSFLPTNYFNKIHSLKGYDFKDLFEDANNIESSLLLKGLAVIW